MTTEDGSPAPGGTESQPHPGAAADAGREGAKGREAASDGERDPESHRTLRAPLDENGMERPKFLLDYPQDPALERLIVAFEHGNYALVRKEAPALARDAADPAVRNAALELRRRIEPDPLAKYLLFIAALLLIYLVFWAYRQGR